MYNIEIINTMQRTADYSVEAVREYEAGLGNGIAKYTDKWEQDYASALKGSRRDDIGGLIVYVRKRKPVAVYDYENFCGWVL